MECISSYYLHDLTEHGGILYDYGQAVLTYEDGIVTVATYKYSIEHLGERTRTSVLLTNHLDKDRVDAYIKYFYNGFYCPYWNRFCEYKTYKAIAMREFNH